MLSNFGLVNYVWLTRRFMSIIGIDVMFSRVNSITIDDLFRTLLGFAPDAIPVRGSFGCKE